MERQTLIARYSDIGTVRAVLGRIFPKYSYPDFFKKNPRGFDLALINDVISFTAPELLTEDQLDEMKLQMTPRDFKGAGQKLSWIPTTQGIASIPDNSTVSFTINDASISQDEDGESQVSTPTTTAIDSYKILTEYLQNDTPDSYSIRVIHLFQRDSWSSLRINSACFNELLQHHNITRDFQSIAAMFSFKRNVVEEAFCGPILQSHTGDSSELAYVLKYPEQKRPLSSGSESWVIRQIGVYQQHSQATGKSVWILLHSNPKSLTVKYVTELLSDRNGLVSAQNYPEVLHLMLFSCYLNNWRNYMAFYEAELLEKTNKALGARLQDLPRVSYDTITRLRFLETKFSSLPSIFASLKSVLNTLEKQAAAESENPYQGYIASCSSLVDSYAANVDVLLRRCSSLSQFIVESTAHTQSELQLRLNQVTVQDSASIKVITVLSLIYLPGSFIATFFGMQFFQLTTPMIWIFFVAAIVLTIVTMIGWWWSVVRTRRKSIEFPSDVEKGEKAA